MADTLFPDIDSDVDIDSFTENNPSNEFVDQEDTEVPSRPYGFTWKMDFNEGDLAFDKSGNFIAVKDRDTLHEWISHTLNTERFETTIYGGDIGTDIQRLIGIISTIDAELLVRVEDEILSAVSIHDRIESVGIVSLIPVNYDIFAVFRYTTDDGITSRELVSV